MKDARKFDEDGSAVSEKALCLRVFWTCLDDLPTTHVRKGVCFGFDRDVHFDADSSTSQLVRQISEPAFYK
jgi:hypothetical protein